MNKEKITKMAEAKKKWLEKNKPELVFEAKRYKIWKIPLNYWIEYKSVDLYTDDDCGLEYAKEVAEHHLKGFASYQPKTGINN